MRYLCSSFSVHRWVGSPSFMEPWKFGRVSSALFLAYSAPLSIYLSSFPASNSLAHTTRLPPSHIRFLCSFPTIVALACRSLTDSHSESVTRYTKVIRPDCNCLQEVFFAALTRFKLVAGPVVPTSGALQVAFTPTVVATILAEGILPNSRVRDVVSIPRASGIGAPQPCTVPPEVESLLEPKL